MSHRVIAFTHAVFFGLCYCVASIQDNKFVALCVLCAAASLVLVRAGGTEGILGFFKQSRLLQFGVALLLINVLWRSRQLMETESLAIGIKELLQDASLVTIGLCILVEGRKLGMVYVLTALALGITLAAFLNNFASLIGFSPINAEDIELQFSSNYTNAERWISPLVNHWQLSGVGRWALPIVLFVSIPAYFKASKSFALILILSACVLLVTLARLEFRTAALPFLCAIVWWLLRKPLLRNGLMVSVSIYFLIAPFLWASEIWLEILDRILPDRMLAIFGAQNATDIFQLSGRVQLYQLLSDNLDGLPLFFGMGPVKYDGSLIIGIPPGWEGRMEYFTGIPFHQSFLDLLCIYGVFPALVIVGVMACGIIKTLRFSRYDPKMAGVALLSLGMACASMSTDSFLKESNVFYIITLFSICAPLLGFGGRWRDDYEHVVNR